MTKPREKNREELQAEIRETGRRKSGSLKTGKRCCGKSYTQEERRTRSHRLIVRGAVFEELCRKPRP